ncbi:SRPBCC family protein [Tessaracoccus sp. Z1128]
MQSRHLSRVIPRPADEVYCFVANPDNLVRWAAGLAQGDAVRKGPDLIVGSPMGQVTVRLVPVNDYGVFDHDVTLPSGIVVTNPARVLPHPDGCEVLFTLRQLDMTDEEFERDARAVEDDLERLAALLEDPDTPLTLPDDSEALRRSVPART